MNKKLNRFRLRLLTIIISQSKTIQRYSQPRLPNSLKGLLPSATITWLFIFTIVMAQEEIKTKSKYTKLLNKEKMPESKKTILNNFNDEKN